MVGVAAARDRQRIDGPVEALDRQDGGAHRVDAREDRQRVGTGGARRSAPHRRSAWDEEELNYLRRKMAVSDDPFFSKPYEANPDAHSPKLDLAHTHLSSTMPQPKTKKPVAALFAMGKKK